MKFRALKFSILFLFVIGTNYITIAQDNNAITTAAQFLSINPDSRSAAMGDAGVATSPDMNSQFLNPAKYAFIDGEMGAAISFTPWLRELVDDINMSTASAYYRLDKHQVVSASLRYFSLGSINFTDGMGNALYSAEPNEFAIDAAYSRLLSDKLSGSVAFRYIYSNLTSGTQEDLQAGNAFAADISFFFKHPMRVNRKESEFTAGINISNIGSKISYDNTNKLFLPANLKLGVGWKTEVDRYNSLSFAFDVNKLLVPSNQPKGSSDDPSDLSVPASIFKSFGDAPNGMSQELEEITFSLGAEYLYNKQFAVRAGYFHEHENQGNRKFASAGVGLKFSMFTLDASYIIAMKQNSALANTMRFSLSFDLSEFK